MAWTDEPDPGYPKRPVARDKATVKQLKKRTLTNLYRFLDVSSGFEDVGQRGREQVDDGDEGGGISIAARA